MSEFFGPVIHSYTRAQALADGALVAVDPSIAEEAGFVVPVALTARVHDECVAWSDDEAVYQDEAGRLWDVLWMARMAIGGAKGQTNDRLTYQLRVVPRRGAEPRDVTPPLVDLVLHIGPGDEGEPVITIMAPGED